MAIIHYTDAARKDYIDIWRYIALDNPAAADRLLDRIESQLRLYAEMPGMGARRHEFALNLRSFPVKNYLVFYRPVSGGIQLLRVLHGARQIDSSFFDPAP